MRACAKKGSFTSTSLSLPRFLFTRTFGMFSLVLQACGALSRGPRRRAPTGQRAPSRGAQPFETDSTTFSLALSRSLSPLLRAFMYSRAPNRRAQRRRYIGRREPRHLGVEPITPSSRAPSLPRPLGFLSRKRVYKKLWFTIARRRERRERERKRDVRASSSLALRRV